MVIFSVTDPSFQEYGQIVDGYDKEELLAFLRDEIEIPDGMAYVPKDERLMRLSIAGDISERFYGGMPAALGWVCGHNTKLNCLEYHRDSELNMGTEDFILLLGRRTQIEDDGTFDTENVKAFRIPAGVMIEIYATTLHYAPCGVNGAGFQVAIVLPRGTNYPLEKPHGASGEEKGEDALITAVNKWLIGHAEGGLDAGSHIGLKGKNLNVNE